MNPLRRSSIRLLVILLTGLVMIHALLFWSLRSQIRDGYPDFTIFYGAGRIVASGMSHQLYDKDVQFRAQQEFTHHVEIRKSALPYNHPPFEALLFVPLSYLSYFNAYLVWDGLNLCFLLLVLIVLRHHVAIMRSTSIRMWFFGALAAFPIFVALLQGQDVILFLLFLTLAYAGFKKRHDGVAGIWLGFGLFRFHFVLPILVLLLLRKNWRAVLGVVTSATAVILISLAVVGWVGLLHYPVFVLSMEKTLGKGSSIVGEMPNLRGLVSLISHGPIAVAVVGGIALLLFGAAFLLWQDSGRELDFDQDFAFAVVSTLLISYHTLAHDLSLLLIPACLTLNYLKQRSTSKTVERLLLACIAFFALMSPLQMVFWFRAGKYCVAGAVLLLWVFGLWRATNKSQPLIAEA